MPEYLSPGVYVEEIEMGPRPIEGVSTSTAGFVGKTRRGPRVGLPTLVTSYPDFVRKHGGPLPDPLEQGTDATGTVWGRTALLAQAVQGFFDNGGQRAYIARVAASDAAPATGNCPDGVVTRLRTRPAPGPTPTLRLESLFGIGRGTTLTLRSTLPGGPADLNVTVDRITGPDAVWVTATAPRANDFAPESTSVIVRAAGVVALELAAKDPGEWGRRLEVRFVDVNPVSTTLETALEVSLTARATPALSFVGGLGPAQGATTIDFTGLPAALAGLAQYDAIEFRLGTTREVRELATVAAAGANTRVTWTPALENEFADASATARLVTSGRRGATETFVSPGLVSGFQNGDAVLLSGAGPAFSTTIGGAPVAATGRIPLDAATPLPRTFREGELVRLRTVAVRGSTDTIRVRSGRAFYVNAIVEITDATDTSKERFTVAEVRGDTIRLGGNVRAAGYQVGDAIRLWEQRLEARYQEPSEGVSIEESYQFALGVPDTQKDISDQIGRTSNLLRVVAERTSGGPPPWASTTTGTWMTLSGGSDGTAPSEDDYVGTDLGPGQRSGIQALREIDEISIAAVPGIFSQTVEGALVVLCEQMKDRFAVLDGPPGPNVTVEGIRAHKSLFETKYAALYHPWLIVRRNQVDVAIPPSGHVLGVYARTDVERGVFKAPANEVVRGITRLEQNLGKGEQDILNPLGVNVIRDFRSRQRGLRIWGARCTTSESPWKYVPVRRLFIFLEESIEDGTQWAVFEPNDRRLWNRLSQSVSRFLTTQWREGALMGDTPEQAFFVKCDESTMTRDDIDNGRLIMVIGVAPVKPAEFVIIRIGQWDGGSSIEELVG
jgi:hypothetical protein